MLLSQKIHESTLEKGDFADGRVVENKGKYDQNVTLTWQRKVRGTNNFQRKHTTWYMYHGILLISGSLRCAQKEL